MDGVDVVVDHPGDVEPVASRDAPFSATVAGATVEPSRAWRDPPSVVVEADEALAEAVDADRRDGAGVDAAGGKPVDELLVPTRPDLGVVTDPAVEDLAPALRVSPGSARYRLAALRRVHGLPRLRFAVTQGLVIGWHAQAVATDLRHLPQESRGRVIDVLLQRIRDRRRRGLRDWTCTELRAQAKAIAARLDLDLASRRREAHRGRGVRLQVHDHGAATISADLAEDVAARIFHRITALAAGPTGRVG